MLATPTHWYTVGQFLWIPMKPKQLMITRIIMMGPIRWPHLIDHLSTHLSLLTLANLVLQRCIKVQAMRRMWKWIQLLWKEIHTISLMRRRGQRKSLSIRGWDYLSGPCMSVKWRHIYANTCMKLLQKKKQKLFGLPLTSAKYCCLLYIAMYEAKF